MALKYHCKAFQLKILVWVVIINIITSAHSFERELKQMNIDRNENTS